MAILAIVAHFDVGRELREHTLSALRNYAAVASRVVVVSTSGLRDEDLDALPPNVDLVTRANYGYDFFSYKWGLDVVGDYGQFDRVLIANDTFVGPIVPVAEVLESDRAQAYDLMGMTWSHNHDGHAQSFFVTMNANVARSSAFQRFWRDMTPISDRKQVIQRYEVGMTAVVRDAGFSVGGYYEPTESEYELAKARLRHQFAVRLVPGTRGRVLHDVRSWGSERLGQYNPAIALADRFLLDARLPLLKFDTLRFDPYGLGSAHLLSAAEAAYPDEMSGVRGFLRETRKNYPFRPREHNVLMDRAELERSGLGYCMDAEFFSLESKEG